jgi:predicted SnoaL-like aldol condensation-catalyzing enzyme
VSGSPTGRILLRLRAALAILAPARGRRSGGLEGDVETAFRTHGGSPYRQHNPLIEDGDEGLRKFVAWMKANRPDAHGEIKRVFADADYVVLHSHWHGLTDSPRGEAVVDIYRCEDGKVVEHWDVIQPIPETAANANTMF